MSHELREGVELSEIIYHGDDFTRLDNKTVLSITVREQMGQMSMIPWAEIKNADGSTELVNLAQVESVTLREPRQ